MQRTNGRSKRRRVHLRINAHTSGAAQIPIYKIEFEQKKTHTNTKEIIQRRRRRRRREIKVSGERERREGLVRVGSVRDST